MSTTLKRDKKCPDCPRTFAMDWAFKNHIKVCAFKFRKENERQNRRTNTGK